MAACDTDGGLYELSALPEALSRSVPLDQEFASIQHHRRLSNDRLLTKVTMCAEPKG